MHELLLHGQVPAPRHEQLLKILAGVAAVQPRRVLERHIIYKPTREPEEPGAHLSRRGGTQNVTAGRPTKQPKQAGAKDLFYTQLVQRLSDDDFGPPHGHQQHPHPPKTPLSAEVKPGEEPKWSLEFQDVPDTGDRGVSIRATNSANLTAGDPHAYMVAIGPHQFVSEYYIEGHRFVHGNVVIFLHRVLHEPGVRSLETEPKTDLPAFSSLQPLDPSGAYILEGKVRVQEFNNTTVLEAGVDELKAFQNQMKGCVELDMPDRLSLDTRVKYINPNTTTARMPR